MYIEALQKIQGILDELDLGDEPQSPPAAPKGKPTFGGEGAPWAIPAARIKTHPEHGKFANEIKNVCPGRFNLNTREWTPTIYWCVGDEPLIPLQIRQDNWSNMKDGDRIPWRPEWRHATDGDAYSLLIQKTTGKCIVIWQTRYDHQARTMRCGAAYEIKDGIHAGGSAASVYTKENGFIMARGCGIPEPFMLVTREEVAAGVIPHCLAGQIARPTRRRFAPATKTIGATGGEGGRCGVGLRFVFDISDEIIGAWLRTLPSASRHAMRAIAVAIRDYGIMICDNGGNAEKKRGSIWLENDINADWGSLGLTEQQTFSLHPLLESNYNSVRVLAEPVFPGGDESKVAVYK